MDVVEEENLNELDLLIKNKSRTLYNDIGAGMREKVYQNGLNLLLNDNHKTTLEYPISINYRGQCLSLCYPDIVMDFNGEQIVLEIKAISRIQLKERLQIEGYIRNMNVNRGYLINFGLRELEIYKYVQMEYTEIN